MSTAAAPLCRACRQPVSTGRQTAFVCGYGIGGNIDLPPPEFCTRTECVAARDRAALDRAIAAGVIDP